MDDNSSSNFSTGDGAERETVPTTAPQVTDSVTTAFSESRIEASQSPDDGDDSETIYSDFSDTYDAKFEGYSKAFAYQLYKSLPWIRDNSESYTAIARILGNRLKIFALRLSQTTTDASYRDIMVFIHKRHRLALPAPRRICISSDMHF